jgi:superfamily II DNA or RNA helicase
MEACFMIILRDYQQLLVEKIRQSYKENKRSPLVVLPTGGG